MRADDSDPDAEALGAQTEWARLVCHEAARDISVPSDEAHKGHDAGFLLQFSV